MKQIILVVHDNTQVLEIKGTNNNKFQYNPYNITETILKISSDFPNHLIAWVHKELLNYIDISNWPQLISHPFEIITYEPGKYSDLEDDIQYIEFGSPFVHYTMAQKNRFATWLMSSSMGMAHAQLLNQFRKWGNYLNSFSIFLISLAKNAGQYGIMPYSEPKLLTYPLPNHYKRTKNKSAHFLSFIKTHYSKKLHFLYFLDKFFYEKKIPLFSFLTAKKVKLPSIKSKKISFQIEIKKINEQDSYDVIIPTLNRPVHLYNFLTDLSKQHVTPKKVIIVEQDPNKKSKIDYLDREWPFEIEHIITDKIGACHARNLALEKVKSKYCFFADDDIRIQPPTLSDALVTMKTFHIPAITLGVYREGEKPPIKTNPTLWHTFGAGCSIVLSKYATTTRFDLSLEHGFGEDADYGMQLRHKGCNIFYYSKYPILHLKAPAGGFRYKRKLPWDNARFRPKPSPTIMLFFKKNATKKQILGYKMFILIKKIISERKINIFKTIISFKKSWEESEKWAEYLKKYHSHL